jgi:hypothetical protein
VEIALMTIDEFLAAGYTPIFTPEFRDGRWVVASTEWLDARELEKRLGQTKPDTSEAPVAPEQGDIANG